MDIIGETPRNTAANLARFLDLLLAGPVEVLAEDEYGHRAVVRDETRPNHDEGPTQPRFVDTPQGFAILIGSQEDDPDYREHVLSRAQLSGETVKRLHVGDFTFEADESEDGKGRATPHKVAFALPIPLVITTDVKAITSRRWGYRLD